MDLPSDEHVVRYVGGAHFDDLTKTINGSAFDRTLKDQDGVSVTRRRVLAKTDKADESKIRKVVGSRLKLGKTAVFAQINVGEALASLAEFDQDVKFIEDALKQEGEYLANPAHALITGLPFEGDVVGSLSSEIAGDRLRTTINHTFSAVI